MSTINISKKDVLWSYFAKFFQIGTGFLTLPLILYMLTSEEIGMNYLMLTVSSMVGLLDFGFSPQFGRNFTYVNSGAQRLLKEGVEYNKDGEINYRLLSTLLKTAKFVYRRLSLICAFVMLTLGTAYIYHVTEGFTNIENSFLIWLLFSLSTYFNIYYTYYNSLLTGSGKVAEANQATIYSRLTYLGICLTMLCFGCGLFSVVFANLISPFVRRFYSYYKYYTPELKGKLVEDISNEEVKESFQTIWYNAKRLGINFLGAYGINKSGMFLIGLYLPLSVVGSYGLLIQMVDIVVAISQTLFNTYQPKFSNYRVLGDMKAFTKITSFTIVVYWILAICGFVAIILAGPWALTLIHSKTDLPDLPIMLIYLFAILLEYNHSLFATLIVTNNEVPFVKAALLSGAFIVSLTFLELHFTDFGLIGVVVIQTLVQLSYNNWRWPKWVLNDLNTTPLAFAKYGLVELKNKLIKH